jgi:hypothetical protein
MPYKPSYKQTKAYSNSHKVLWLAVGVAVPFSRHLLYAYATPFLRAEPLKKLHYNNSENQHQNPPKKRTKNYPKPNRKNTHRHH